MAGRIILWVLLGLVLLIVALLQVPVKIRASYEDGAPLVRFQYGPLRRQLFPPPEREEKEEAQKPSEKKPKKEKEKKAKAKINREQIFYALEKLPPILGRALRRTGRSIRFQPLKVYVLAAGYDPADTALLYGRLEAALHGAVPVLERAVRIKEEDIRLFVDFTAREMDVIADVGVSLRPGSLVWIALRAGGSLLKWYFGFRRLASPPPEDTAERKKKGKEESGANGENTEHEAA